MNRKKPADRKSFKVDARFTARELELIDLFARDLGGVSRGEVLRRLVHGLRVRRVGIVSRGRLVLDEAP